MTRRVERDLELSSLWEVRLGVTILVMLLDSKRPGLTLGPGLSSLAAVVLKSMLLVDAL